ncbi:MAG: DUF3299 domain-containing protein [Candidatus Anammoximicrobium sp.]|nr:DUF3299 domain-containing protein [Candidatus Anammoximicrobium sp.]
MSSAEILEHTPDHEDTIQSYRAVCKSAVFCLVLGLLSGMALLFPVLLLLPAVGLLAGLMALTKLRRYPEELSGRTAAVIGLVLCVSLLVGGVVLHSVVYATEVPEGFQRISFAELQPVPEAPHLPVPPNALELNGKKVFLKGYVYPDGQQYNIKRFILIPDMGTCCFGGQPKLTDMVEVTLRDPLRTIFERRKRRLAGTLTVDTRLKPVSGLGGVYYRLDAEYVR